MSTIGGRQFVNQLDINRGVVVQQQHLGYALSPFDFDVEMLGIKHEQEQGPTVPAINQGWQHE